MPQDDNSSAQKLNCNEFIEFDDEADSIKRPTMQHKNHISSK